MIGGDQPHEVLRVVDGRDGGGQLGEAGLLDLVVGLEPIAGGHRLGPRW